LRYILGVQMYMFIVFHQNQGRNFLLLLFSVVYKDFFNISVIHFRQILGIGVQLQQHDTLVI